LERTPEQEYRARLEERRGQAERVARRERALSHARLAVFLAGVASAWWVVARGHSLAWLAFAVAAFVALVMWHDAARRASARAARSVRFYERRFARLEHRFAGTGTSGDEHLPPDHPYAVHLDLFGRGSLFELLCGAQTRAGEETLARWLLAPAGADEIRARHAAVAELRPRLDLREALALAGPELPSRLAVAALVGWAREAPSLHSRARRAVAAALAAFAAASGLGLLLGFVGPLPFLVALLLEGAFALAVRRGVGDVVAHADLAVRELARLAPLLARLEREPMACERLLRIRRSLEASGHSPSRELRRLERWVQLLDSRRNQMFALIAPLVLWTTQCALAIEAWRVRCGPAVEQWLAAIGELEALCDLAGYAYDHPADPFPELVDAGPCFQARGLGHPLIAESRCVRNDLELGDELRLLVVSGSNMSGKTTLLRSVGTNAVLAQAGAPVRAERLRISPLSIGASIRVLDSLQEGVSRFYAEITQLRLVASLAAGEAPLLFLLDEVLQGTNSHDRRIGAEGILRGLLARGAAGLVTTHDLALARIADALAPRAANVHFQDEMRDGRLHFDYSLRAGVVERSNALELMRAVGLEV
jgi:hypothetical protein